jgi:type IV secretion system protein VirB10
MLLSVVDGVVQSEASRGNAVVLSSGNSSSQILGEVLKDTIGIPPTVTIAAGTAVHALVARDIDFRSVYELRLTDPAS